METRFKTAFDPHSRVHPELDPKSLTHQSMAPECDINTIMKKYERTGVLEHRNTFEGRYGDFTDGPEDYHTSMNAVLAAEEMFSTLPAKLRRRFHNDPGAFLEYVGNPENQDEMVKLGLATRPSKPEPPKSGTPTPKSPSGDSKAPPKEPKEPSNGD